VSSEVRIGLIGTGRIARVHADAYRRVEGGAIVSCVDLVPEFAAAFAHEFGIAVDASVEALLARDDLDAVLVASPNGEHADHVIAALDAGKHVFCQKPIALTRKDADRIVERADASDRVSQFGFMLRFTPPLGALRTRVAEGELGELIAFRAAVFGWEPSADWFYDPRFGGGVILDTLVHFADLVLWLLGPVTHVYSDGGAYVLEGAKRHGSPDNATVQLRHTSGAMSSLYATWTAGHGNFTCELYGVDGSVSIDLVEKQATRVFRRAGDPGARGFSFPDLVWPYGYTGEQQHFVDHVRGRVGGEPAADVHDARAALELVLAMQDSLDEGRVVELA
jgi:myo-inositol 2-dehydrogenase / D-chiro-inositol 1-dehydrogenase